MEGLLSIFEKTPQPRQEYIDEEKLRYIASKVAIWDYFGIFQAHYLALNKTEKSRMLSECYRKLLPVYFGDRKKPFFACLSGFWNSEFWIFYYVWVWPFLAF